MNKVLMVDDDYIITRSYKRRVQWEEIGVGEVLTADCPETAMAAFMEMLPNVVVCDIEMPGMTGLELAEWMLRRRPQTKIIFLSAFDNFKYAQRAVSLGSRAYLLKPVSVEELSSAVEAAIDEYDSEQCNEEYAKLARYWLANRESIQDRFVFDLINGGDADLEQIEAQASQLGIVKDGFSFGVVVLGVTGGDASFVRALSRILRSGGTDCGELFCVVEYGSFVVVVAALPKESGMIALESISGEMTKKAVEELCITPDSAQGICANISRVPSMVEKLTGRISRQTGQRSHTRSDTPVCEQIIMYILGNIDLELSKGSIAEHVAMNADYMCKIFKKQTGYSLSDYITVQKMIRAKQLLLETNSSISSIATQLGFSNFSYFTKLFKEQFGLTPRRLRQTEAEK